MNLSPSELKNETQRLYEAGVAGYDNPDFQPAAVGDLDGDGTPEMIGFEFSTGNLEILEATGDDTFAAIFNGVGSFDRLDDVLGDGRSELVEIDNSGLVDKLREKIREIDGKL